MAYFIHLLLGIHKHSVSVVTWRDFCSGCPRIVLPKQWEAIETSTAGFSTPLIPRLLGIYSRLLPGKIFTFLHRKRALITFRAMIQNITMRRICEANYCRLTITGKFVLKSRGKLDHIPGNFDQVKSSRFSADIFSAFCACACTSTLELQQNLLVSKFTDHEVLIL